MVLVRNFRGSDSALARNQFVKRSSKRKKVDIKRIATISLVTVVAVGVVYGVYSHLPFVKVNKAIAAGNMYSKNEDYEAAISSYNTAIEIDDGAVEAYNNMAGAYLSIDDSESAKKILFDGWQNTDNTDLLNNYHTVILNDAVTEINRGNGSIDALLSILPVLEADNTNSQAIEILDAAFSRCFANESTDADMFFRGESKGSTCSFAKYEELVNRLLAVYTATPSDELSELIKKFAIPATDSFTIDYSDALKYGELLQSVVSGVGSNASIDSMFNCFNNAQEVQGLFSQIFEQLDIGNVDELRDFIVSDEYVSYRDIFLNDQETPQENTTYISISREAMILNLKDGNWSYRFLSFDENPESTGVITVWANYFEDDGVQRNSISYEPGAINGNIYPHTKYSVTYLKSYITSGNSTKVAQMNYRLSTLITDEEGNMTETVVGDWGGANEWIMDIETIESRIRA